MSIRDLTLHSNTIIVTVADPEHISPCTASPILLPQPVKISSKPLISKSSSSSNQLPVIQPPINSATPHTSGTTQGNQSLL